MASFVEQATLRVVDQSSGQINKINAALKRLQATANKLKGSAVKNATTTARAQKAAATGQLMTTRQIIRAQRGLLEVERKTAAARQASTAEMIRANRGANKILNEQAKAVKKIERAERSAATGRQASAAEIVRANRGVNKILESQAKAVKNVERAERSAATGKLATTQQVIRAQRGLVEVERKNAAARQASTAEIIRANRGVNKILEDQAKARQKVQRELASMEKAVQRERNRVAGEEARTQAKQDREQAQRRREPREPAAARPGGAPPGAFVGGGDLRQFLTGLLGYSLVTAVGHAIKEGAIQGTKQLDIGENKLRMQQLDTVLGRNAETLAMNLVHNLGLEKAALPGGAFLNRGQRMGIYAESLGASGLDPHGAKQATSMLEELVRSGVALGQTQERAVDQAYNFVKAADMMGRMVYQQKTLQDGIMHEAGSFRYAGATADEAAKARLRGIAPPDTGLKNFMDYMQKLQPEIGKEFEGQFVRGIAKYLGATRMGISNQAFGATLLLGEDMGTRAAVGYRQAVKQLSGIEQTKDRMATLAELGLLKYKMGGTKKRPKIISEGPIDDALMKQNLPAWIAKNIYAGQGGARYDETDRDPKKRGRLIDPDSPLAKIEKKLGRAFNLEFPEDVQELSRRLVGNSNALDTLSSYLFNSAEIQRKLAQVDKRDPEAIRKILESSPVVAAQQLQNQFQGLMGETIVAAKPLLTPMMQGAAEGMRYIGGVVQTAFGGGPDAGKAQLELMTGGAAAALTAKFGSAALGGIIGTIGQTIGTVAGFQGLMDPKTAPLAGAGLALQGAASSLQTAAGMQMAAAAGNWAMFGRLAKGAVGMALPVAGLAAILGGSAYLASLPEGERDKKLTELANRERDLTIDKGNLEKQLIDLEKRRDVERLLDPREKARYRPGGPLSASDSIYQKIEAEKLRLAGLIKGMNDEIQQIQDILGGVPKVEWPFGAGDKRKPEDIDYKRPDLPGHGIGKDVWVKVPLPTKEDIQRVTHGWRFTEEPKAPGTDKFGRTGTTVKPVRFTPGVRFIAPGADVSVPKPRALPSDADLKKPPDTTLTPENLLRTIQQWQGGVPTHPGTNIPTGAPHAMFAPKPVTTTGAKPAAAPDATTTLGTLIQGIPAQFAAVFSAGKETLAGAGTGFAANAAPALAEGGTRFGTSAAGAINPGALGAAMGSAARAQLEGITINVNVPNLGGGGSNPSNKGSDTSSA